MSIYVITHKRFEKYTTDQTYKTLLVGANKGHIFGDFYDDIGDNISEKNESFCELTGIYWLWKNCTDDYIGVVHYRRYFTHSYHGLPVITDAEIRHILNKYDIILPFEREYNITIGQDYCKVSGFQCDLDKLRDSISRLYPEYINSFDTVFKGNRTYLYNMFIVKKEDYDKYCQWLFEILFDVEKCVDTSNYNAYQKRVFGFMSERLMTVWVLKNRLKVFEMGILPTEEPKNGFTKFLIGLKRAIKYRLNY